MIGIGIDTGGTYTDGVVFDTETMTVLASCKSLTTKEDLAIGIGNTLDALPVDKLAQAQWASLSTTLATNACVENKGGRAKLVLIGSSQDVLRRIKADQKYGLEFDNVLCRDSKGTYDGKVVDEPDWEQFFADNEEFFADAEALAISDVHVLRNGGIIERNGSAFLNEKTGLPTIQAISVANELNVMERGATALLNARLLPVVKQFMDAVHRALELRGLDIPVLIVRSDGTLMSDAFARKRPVETILSGPASSVNGARGLTDTEIALVVDMGGTTTDISVVHENDPVMTGGIHIGGWRTQIKGVYIDTIGLGGDSAVCFGKKHGGLELSPRKVTPMCVAATRWPRLLDDLKELLEGEGHVRREVYEAIYLVREPKDLSLYNDHEKRLLDIIVDEGYILKGDPRFDPYALRGTTLEDEGITMRAGMTPTDAMHLKGDFTTFDTRASRLAALYLAKLDLDHWNDPEEERIQFIADSIYRLAEHKLFDQVVRVLFTQRFGDLVEDGLDNQMKRMADVLWDEHMARVNGVDLSADKHIINLRFDTPAKLIGIGAPTHIFLPAVADAIGTECIIPDHAEVANAVGAALSEIVVNYPVFLEPNHGPDGVVMSYQVRSAEDSTEFEEYEDAEAFAIKEAERLGRIEAVRRGALGELACTVTKDVDSVLASDGSVINFGTTFTARVYNEGGIDAVLKHLVGK